MVHYFLDWKSDFNDCSVQFGCFYITVAIFSWTLLNVVIGSEASHYVFWEDFTAQPGRVILFVPLLNCVLHTAAQLTSIPSAICPHKYSASDIPLLLLSAVLLSKIWRKEDYNCYQTEISNSVFQHCIMSFFKNVFKPYIVNIVTAHAFVWTGYFYSCFGQQNLPDILS